MSRGESKVGLLRLFLSLLLSPDPTRATPVIMAKHDRVGSGVKLLVARRRIRICVVKSLTSNK